MPREHGCQMWRDWSEAHVDRDFKQIKELGLNTVRTFLFWPDFQPSPGKVSEEAISKFNTMLNIADKHGLKLIPTFFAGHMSGENFDVPWREGRDIYEDPFMLKSQVELVRYFGTTYEGAETILCWDLANELDTFLQPRSADAGWLWTHILYRELKTYDPSHPVTLGTHVSSLEKDKFRFDNIAADFLCTHPYPMYTRLIIDPLDSIRSTLYPAFACKLAECLGGRKVMLEEFGTSTEMTSRELSARFYRSVLYSSLANDTIGALAWCFADYTTSETPYKTSTHELEFGIVGTNGHPKKQATVLERFSRDVEQIHYADLVPEKRKVAIVIPAFYYRASNVYFPDYSQEDFLRSLFSAFVLAKQANFNVDFIQPEAIPSIDYGQNEKTYELLILPCVSVKGYLTIEHWEKIKKFVEAGGNLYCSYSGIALPGLGQLFGFEIERQEVAAPEVYLKVPARKKYEEQLTYQTTGSKMLAVKNVEKSKGEVLYQDQSGKPAVIKKEHDGGGTTLFVTYPIEYCLSFMPNAAAVNNSYKLYRIAHSNIQESVTYEDPFVEAKLFYATDSKYLLFVNHSNAHKALAFDLRKKPAHVEFVSPANSNTTKHEDTFAVDITPNGYSILRIID